jgi:NCS1 family nucleobase:cation symporter-1
MLLIGHAGAKWGVPYAVLARASFGWRGARAPALARAIVACGWYGIQTWIGGGALLTLLGVMLGKSLVGPMIPVLGIGVGQLLSFAAFWADPAAVRHQGPGGRAQARDLDRAGQDHRLRPAGLVGARARPAVIGPILHEPSAYDAGGAKAGRFWHDFGPPSPP